MFTPFEVSFLIHCYMSYAKYPNINSPYGKKTVKKFINLDLISEDCDENPDTFKLTERGNALLQMILETPIPVKKIIWVRPEEEKGRRMKDDQEM